MGRVERQAHAFMDAFAFNQPIDKWDVSSVTNMNEMFEGAVACIQIPSWYKE